MNEQPKNKKALAAAFWGTLFVSTGIGILLINLDILKPTTLDPNYIWPLAF